MANIAYEIDRKDFERFLAENPERVFDQDSIHHCAIAEYLISTGLNSPSVGLTWAAGNNGATRIQLAPWASAVSMMEPRTTTAREILDFLATMPEDSHAD